MKVGSDSFPLGEDTAGQRSNSFFVHHSQLSPLLFAILEELRRLSCHETA